MPTDPLRLRALTQTAIEEATAKYNAGGSRQAWEAEMQSAIGRGHIAAFLAATSERLNVPLDSPLLSRARLSDAERVDIKDAIRPQLEYLKGFSDGLDGMSPEAVLARANLYAGATRATYYQNVTEADLPAYPGDGSSECMGNCGCAWEPVDGGYTWVRGKSDSCATCVQRAGEWAPYKVAAEATPEAAAPEAAPFEPREFASMSAADKLLSKESPVGKDDLTYFEQAAMQNYQHNGYKDINGALRTGSADMLAEAEREIKLIDSVLERSTTASDLQAYRGLVVKPGSAAEELVNNWTVGGTYREPGYMSTTIDPNRINKFFKSLPAEDRKGAEFVDIYVRVPAGTNALYMNGAVVQEGMQNYKEERELLLARDTKYRIISKETQPNGRTLIEMEVVDDDE